MGFFKHRWIEFEETIKDLESRLKDRGISIGEEYLSSNFIKSLVYFLGPGDYACTRGREEAVRWFRNMRKIPGFDIEVATESELRDRFGNNTESCFSRSYVSRLNNGLRVRAIRVGHKHNTNYQEDLAAYKHQCEILDGKDGKIYYKVLNFRVKQFECSYCQGNGGWVENIPVSVPGGNAILSESGEYQTCNQCCGAGIVSIPNFSDDEFKIYEKVLKKISPWVGHPSKSWPAFLRVR